MKDFAAERTEIHGFFNAKDANTEQECEKFFFAFLFAFFTLFALKIQTQSILQPKNGLIETLNLTPSNDNGVVSNTLFFSENPNETKSSEQYISICDTMNVIACRLSAKAMKRIAILAVACALLLTLHAKTDEIPFVELKGHTDWVRSAEFSPDGKKVLTGSEDKTARIWDAESGKELFLILKGHTDWIYSAVFSFDGKTVLTGSSDKTARIWDSESGKEIHGIEGHADYVSSAVFSPDGKRVVTGSGDKTARIWDVEKKRELRKFEGHTNTVTSVAFSPDGKKIVTGSHDDTARIWDVESGKELQKLKGHTHYICSVTFSPDGKKVLTGSQDKTARIWDVESGKELKKIAGHTHFVVSAAFSPDGKKVVTGSQDNTARIWDADSGEELHTLEGHTNYVLSAVFSPDGKKVITGSADHTARIWDISALDKKPSPLDLPPLVEDEDDNAYRERILAEERAKELALIEAERKIIPLVEEPDKLIPLDEQDRIWITPDRKSVVLIGKVVLREGFLELLACRVASKEHESILAVRVKPMLIHAALLAANARQGKPMQTKPTFVPASGDKINITLRWKDNTGKQHECPAQDWVWDMSSSKEDAKKPMTTHWVFSGSKEYQDDEGKRRYLAEETGELFGLSNFVGSILDVPIESSHVNTELQFGCFTERIPPVETPVTIVLTPDG